MRFVEDCKFTLPHEEVWIIGCGTSLDLLGYDFFDNKTAIAVNWVIVRFPDVAYWCCARAELALAMKLIRKPIMKKSIFAFPFAPCPGWDITGRESLRILGDCKDEPIFMHWRRLDFKEKAFRKYLPDVIQAIKKRKPCKYIGLTITHCAIEIAAMMGAKKITLVGCEDKCSRNFRHAQRGGLSYFYVENPDDECSPEAQQGLLPRQIAHKNGTRVLAKALQPLGISLREYYADKGYQKI